jgi:peptidoglycan/xylan/chitin deacetylase (PgdA/CDA1 family)
MEPLFWVNNTLGNTYMKKANEILLFAVFLLYGSVAYSGTIAPPYEVGNWQGFRTAAVSYTFDDGYMSNLYSVAIPMFDEYGFKLTVYPVIDWGPNWTALQSAAVAGHEVGSHTVTHDSLDSLTIEQQTTQLVDSQNTINSYIPGNQCVTIAYPYCAPSDQALTATYYIGGRHCQGVVEANTPSNIFQISSIILGVSGINTAAGITAKDDTAAASKGWCVFLIHAIDNDSGYSPLSSAVLRQSLQYLDAHRGTFWVQTFANVVRYIRERNDVSIAELSSSDSSITLSVTDDLNDTIYNYPVTIRRPLPAGWPAANAVQNGHAAATSIVEVNSVRYVMFDAVPDDGNVVLIKAPGAPENLTAHAGYKKISLDWDDNNEADLAGYNVYRSATSGEGFAKLNSSLLSSSNYDDNDIPHDTNYYYVVTAADTNLIESLYSSEVSGHAAYNMTVKKCTVTAGKTEGFDGIAVSGDMNAVESDLADADYIRVIIDSNDVVSSYIQTFPIDGNSFKKGKFNCTIKENASSASFKFDTKTRKFSFTAKNIDLSGLDCPLVNVIEVGDYACEAEVNEAIVNGKKPIPIKLLMGIKDSLRVDKSKFARDRNTGNVTQIAVSGGFSVEDLNDANMADNDFTVGLAGQTFTIPAGSFKPGKNKFSCSKIVLLPDGEIAAATFDTNKCTFTLTIKNTNFAAGAGATDFGLEFGDFSETAKVSLP